MSDQQAEPISGESGSLGAGPAASPSTDAPVTAATPEPVSEPVAGSAEVEISETGAEAGRHRAGAGSARVQG